MGVANVESTMVKGTAIAPSSARSANANEGLAGVSAMTNMVRGVFAAAVNAPGTVAST